MATVPRLPKHLREALGPDATEELVTILDEMRAQHADHLAAIRREFSGVRGDVADFRREMRADMERLEKRLDGRFDKVDERFSALEARVADVKSDLMKWSFVFWCGAVTAVAALAGVLRS